MGEQQMSAKMSAACNCDGKAFGCGAKTGGGCGAAPFAGAALSDDVPAAAGNSTGAAANSTNPIVFGMKEGLHRGARQSAVVKSSSD
jgi:hypothetical protein